MYTVYPKIFEGENFRGFRGFLSGLKNFNLENFGPSQAPLEKSCETSKILSRKFLFKGKITKILTLENFRLYGIALGKYQ